MYRRLAVSNLGEMNSALSFALAPFGAGESKGGAKMATRRPLSNGLQMSGIPSSYQKSSEMNVSHNFPYLIVGFSVGFGPSTD
jgi:hypothetical protein